ncbi:MAG: hypothetical protein Fur002_03070 [Anaerolineales bacterium]
MNLSRLFKIAAQLGLRPLFFYARYQMGLRSGHYRQPPKTFHPQPFHALFSAPSQHDVLQALGEDGKEKLLQEANEILAGKFRRFGGAPVPLQLLNPLPLHHWTSIETGKVKYDGDLKLLWEAARFGWAFTLGRAYHITQNRRYAKAFWTYAETFFTSNAVNEGAHWMNGQEVALRMMALIWALHVFPLDESQQFILLTQISYHAQRVLQTLDYARAQENNHLVTESAALYSAGRLLNQRRWTQTGWRLFHHAIQTQINDYGEYIQHSVNYHRVMLHAALWMNLVKAQEFPRQSAQALARAAHWLFSMLDADSGRVPNLGSNDGALILPLSACPYEDYRPAVQAAARAFLNASLESGAWDELSLWLNLPAAPRAVSPREYLSENLHGADSWAYLRATSFKSRLAHIDQLHLDLWRKGENIAQDAGTYSYNAPPPWNNPLAAARVHNTLTVLGAEPMTRMGRFMTLDWASAYSTPLLVDDASVISAARAHYVAKGIRYERAVYAYQDGRWLVRDSALPGKRAARIYRLHWLLIDGAWNIQEENARVTLRVQTPRGQMSLRVTTAAAPRVSLVCAGELLYGERDLQPYEGWVSRSYGEKSAALSFAVEITSPFAAQFVSEFDFA